MDDEPGYANHRIDLNYDPQQKTLHQAVRDIAAEAVAAVQDHKVIIVLSDRHIGEGNLPVHALLATGATHHELIRQGCRCDANLIIETGTARDPHHMAVLVGYGATCVHPYLAYETIDGMIKSNTLDEDKAEQYIQNYRRGINKGLLKILSKMGISTITSYRGAQLFEIVGLHEEIVDLCFNGTTSRIQGLNFDDLGSDQQLLADNAWNDSKDIAQGGCLLYTSPSPRDRQKSRMPSSA